MFDNLREGLTQQAIRCLHYFDTMDAPNFTAQREPMTATELNQSQKDGESRYRTDPIFHAKVCMLVNSMCEAIETRTPLRFSNKVSACMEKPLAYSTPPAQNGCTCDCHTPGVVMFHCAPCC